MTTTTTTLASATLGFVASLAFAAPARADGSYSPEYSFCGAPGATPRNNVAVNNLVFVDTNDVPMTAAPNPFPTLTGEAVWPDSTTVPVEFEDYGDGSVGFWYVSPVAGEHVVTLYADGVPLENCILEATAYAPDPAFTYASGTGTVDLTTGNPVIITIHSMDSNNHHFTYGNNPPTVTITRGNDTVNHVLFDNLDGTYTVPYTPTHNGSYEVEILLDGQHIQGSPFHLVAN